jgi:hypothetical protein
VIKADFAALANDISKRTARSRALHRLFTDVFDRVIPIDYRQIVDDPRSVFQTIADEAGFEFTDDRLIGTKLNGLDNRLMIYNPFVVGLSRPVRFRFEASPAIELCEDWGSYRSLDVDCSTLGEIADRVGNSIGVGISVTDEAALTVEDRELISSADFLGSVLPHAAGIHLASHRFTADVYRNNVYRTALPDELTSLLSDQIQNEDRTLAEVMAS